VCQARTMPRLRHVPHLYLTDREDARVDSLDVRPRRRDRARRTGRTGECSGKTGERVAAVESGDVAPAVAGDSARQGGRKAAGD